jgi:hypothetical protein
MTMPVLTARLVIRGSTPEGADLRATINVSDHDQES